MEFSYEKVKFRATPVSKRNPTWRKACTSELFLRLQSGRVLHDSYGIYNAIAGLVYQWKL